MKRSTIAALVAGLVAGVVFAGVPPGGGGMTRAQADARYVNKSSSWTAPTLNTPVKIVGNCNPATTSCVSFAVDNGGAPSTSNKLQVWRSNGVDVATMYSTGTLDVYPSNLSGNVVFANTVQDPTGSGGVTVLSDRSAASVNTDFVVNTSNTRTAGSLQAWQNNNVTKAQLDPTGQFIGGVGGVGSFASFQDGSGVSGHASLTCASAGYVVLMGRLGGDQIALQDDGGRPASDGGHWVVTELDGGRHFAYGGVHGDVTIVDEWSNVAGVRENGSAIFLQQWLNPWVDGTTKGANSFIDHSGAFLQRGSMTLADFEALPTLITTNLGQMYFGQFESSLMYAFGSSANEHHWFVQGPANPDGGSTYDYSGANGTWRQLPYADETLIASTGPSGTPGRLSYKLDSSTFSSGTKTITLSAALQFATTPSCWCNDTSGSAIACSYAKGSSSSTSLVFKGTGTDAFDWFCLGR